MDKDEIIKEILEENVKLKEELQATKEHLKKYTAPSNKKLYYEQNKDEIKQKVKEYKEKSNYVVPQDVIAERNKRAYQKRKEKLGNQNI
jgi:cell division protein FtsB